MSWRTRPEQKLTIDLTMNLVNRTGVYDTGQELTALSHPNSIRYWRLHVPWAIPFARHKMLSNAGKLVGRVALWELAKPGLPPWPRKRGRTLFIDPLFVRQTALTQQDIVLCHDVGPISHPQYYDRGAEEAYDAAFKHMQASKPGLVFVSEYTRREYMKLYPADYPWTQVITPYYKPVADEPKIRIKREKPFVLMAAVMERRKNYRNSIEAFKRSGLIEQGYELVIMGPRGNDSTTILPLIEETPSVVHLGFLSNEEVAAHYRAASCLLFASLLEGFGVPSLEAPHAGIIPIVSRGTVLEEIVGPDGVVVDPESIDDIAQALRTVVLMSPEEKKKTLDAIREHQKQFSIELWIRRWSALLNGDAPPARAA